MKENNAKADNETDEVVLLKKEVEHLKQALHSVSESGLLTNIETQKFKIHNIEKAKISISWLFHESKRSSIIVISLPLLMAIFAFRFAQSILSGLLQGQTEALQAMSGLGFNIAPMLGMMPLIVFIIVYVFGFKILSFIAGVIVKQNILKREKNKLKILESQLPK